MPTAKKLVALLHRHGSTLNNELNQYRSHLDPSLDAKGVEQAEESADFLEKYDIEKIVTSPMLRAYQTASITYTRFPHVPFIQDRGLMPWNLGFLAGKDRDTFAEILQFYVDNPYKTVPQGDALDVFKQRTEQFFTQEFEKDEGLTMYCCHTSNIITLSNLLSGDSTMQAERHEAVGPGGILAIFEGGGGLEMEPIYGEAKPQTYGVS
jgi:broad specificity phosphatase PhoE